MAQPQVPLAAGDAQLSPKEEWLKNMRGSLLVVAVLVASVTYTAGLNPPGGFWQEDQAVFPDETTPYFRGRGHFAGDPVMRDENYNRFFTFMASNTVAFVQSLVIIVLLMTELTFHGRAWLYPLRVFVVIHVLALVVSYGVGSTRDAYGVFLSLFVIAVATLFCATTTLGIHFHYGTKDLQHHVANPASLSVAGLPSST